MSETTDFAFSYEYGVDIDVTPDAELPTWQRIRFPSAIDPQTTPITQPAETYDDLGSPNAVKLSESWTLGFTVQAQRAPSTGAFLPEVEALLAATRPDAVGQKATRRFRWYDKPAAGTPNPDEAYTGKGTVTVNRQNTGNDQIAGFSVTVTGQGRRTKITNPAVPTGGGAPTVTSALPSGAAVGAQITIKGAGFTGVTGATGVKVGAVNATSYTVVDSYTIVAVVPAGTAGSAPITVTHPTNGASAAFAYTRGA